MKLSGALFYLSAVAALMLSACYSGVDPAAPDVMKQDATVGTDTGGGNTCGKAVDGTPCGQAASGNICRGGACVASYCGDLFVDTNRGEECEDNNLVDNDGCTQCRHDCKKDADCADKESCNGVETCQQASHTCKGGIVASDLTVCKMSDGKPGACKAGVCVSQGCGDKIKNGTEECDDGNTVAGDGCENDCTWTCKADADCDDKNPCTGKETCNKSDPKKPVCKVGTKVSCKHAKCTGTCQSTSGTCLYPDADKDGVDCRTDCNEKDNTIFPGATECPDGKDNDCNPSTADGSGGKCVCWKDSDGDGFAPTGATTVGKSGACPSGYTDKDPAVSSNVDCFDSSKDVYPGQTAWMTTPYCKSGMCLYWDYNCNGKTDKQYPSAFSQCLNTRYGCFGSGWSGSNVLACGKKALYVTCSSSTCKPSTYLANRTQACH
jgi:cysteine-rich repeat protein